MAETEGAGRLGEGAQVRAFIQGTLFGTMAKDDYPLKIRDFEEWTDEEDNIKSFSVVTASGLRFHIKVEFEGVDPA